MKKSGFLFVMVLVVVAGNRTLLQAQQITLSQKNSDFIQLVEKNKAGFTSGIRADNTRSDSIDILDYDIKLNITNLASKYINGSCKVTFISKLDNCSFIDLDLLSLTVDSVMQGNQQVLFNYSNEVLLRVYFPEMLNIGDTAAIVVYYHGNPATDISGWGGFYFTNDYAYNLGVGFEANPHCYGRVWFPCFDNFVERSTYHFEITTQGSKMALCNGELTGSTDNSDGTKTWHWLMQDNIPSYLASVAVGSYAPVHFNYDGIESAIPVQLGAVATDTIKLKNSFVHLQDALSLFENAFGPFRWNKVGYALVPFSSGAMEHATNVAYPIFMADGTLNWESFYVHELSHNWFGNLVTCRTEQDMWMNEGWATFCERLFLEHVYGKENYDAAVAANHSEVVHFAHTPAGDGSYLPVSGIPHDYTYGVTVYDKGSDVIHTLRSYLGDSLFFHCITNFLSTFSFSDAASEDLRDFLTDCSGIDLYHFFDDWIFNPGFPQFSIDSVGVVPMGNEFGVNVFIRQKLDHAPHFYQNVPLEITFMDKTWNSVVETTMLNGECSIYSTTLPFAPAYAGLDLAEKISDAITAGSETVKTTGVYNIPNSGVTLNVNSLPDSAFIRAEHNYVPPDPFMVPVNGLHISDYHYWKIDGLIPDGFDATATFHYDGSNSFSTGYLDNNLITNSEDSLVLLYRPSPKYDWSILTDLSQNFTGSHNDKRGYFTVNHLTKGEYAFAIYDYDKIDSATGIGNNPCQLLSAPAITSGVDEEQLLIYPNPSSENVTVSVVANTRNELLEIYDLYGRLMFHKKLPAGNTKWLIATNGWQAGPYLVTKTNMQHHRVASKILIVTNKQ